VLEFALRGLDDKNWKVLRTIAAFRMPANYDALAAVLTGETKPCADERELDAALSELDDRGLLGWDKRANRYDLHPIVRDVVWDKSDADTKRSVLESLNAHFESIPMVPDQQVTNLADLPPALDLCNQLAGS